LRFKGENKCKRGKNQGKRHAGGVNWRILGRKIIILGEGWKNGFEVIYVYTPWEILNVRLSELRVLDDL
jgi:hypothetical protein